MRDTGISRSTLSDWMNGTRPRCLGDVRKLARYLNVSFEDLLFGDGEDVLEDGDRSSELIFEGVVKMRLERINSPNIPSGNDSFHSIFQK